MAQVRVHQTKCVHTRGCFEDRLFFSQIKTEHGRKHEDGPQWIVAACEQLGKLRGSLRLRELDRFSGELNNRRVQSFQLRPAVLRQR